MVVAIWSTVMVPGMAANVALGYPTIATSSFGPVRAWAPIVPTSVPGKRSPSSSPGTDLMRLANAGEA